AWDWYHLEGLTDPAVQVWLLHLMALAGDLEEPELERLADRLMLAGEDRRLLVSFPARVEQARNRLRAPDLLPHQAVEALEPLGGEELLLLMADEDERVRAWVRRHLSELRSFELGIRGADLVAAGVPPGPRIGEALKATKRARLDGRIEAGDELRFALEEI
ncbi:MAG: hypothetical protein ACLGI9_20115, partial [Thermoanaerobaculia bacterium]